MILASFRKKLASFRKDEGISADFEGFYPLGTGMKSTIYLFGRASLSLRGPAADAPLPLMPAAGSADDPGVAIIALPANRDVYAIGVGMDAAAILKSLFAH
jgi:hypothetical protein